MNYKNGEGGGRKCLMRKGKSVEKKISLQLANCKIRERARMLDRKNVREKNIGKLVEQRGRERVRECLMRKGKMIE